MQVRLVVFAAGVSMLVSCKQEEAKPSAPVAVVAESAKPPAPPLDAGVDAGSEAAPDAGAVTADAGVASQDAGTAAADAGQAPANAKGK